MNTAYLLNNVVVFIAPDGFAPPAGLVYDATRDATGGSAGDTWNGAAYVPPPEPVEVTNAKTLRQQAEAALVANRTAITNAQNWIAANPGTLTTATLSIAMRQVMQALIDNAQQHNGLIRQMLNKYDGTN